MPEIEYINALIKDLDEDLAAFPSREIGSIFIGGGTPSLFSPFAFEKLLQALQQRLSFTEDIEITIEANPGAIDQARFSDYRTLGINRLSLGIQSFNPNHLRALGRIHDDKQAHRAIENSRLAGFDNINLDIMHGLPGQSVNEGLDDLKTALSYAPEHLSWYQLTIEPNTVFYKKKPALPNEEILCELEDLGLAELLNQKYQRYEVSAFCRNKQFSRHNLNYWLFGDYIGIGAGAHGKHTRNKIIYRTRKHRQPSDYLDAKKPFLAEKKIITADDALFEFMLNTTRLQQAIPYVLFSERTSLPEVRLQEALNLAQKQGLVTLHHKAWQVTEHGRRYTNDLQALFLPENSL